MGYSPVRSGTLGTSHLKRQTMVTVVSNQTPHLGPSRCCLECKMFRSLWKAVWLSLNKTKLHATEGVCSFESKCLTYIFIYPRTQKQDHMRSHTDVCTNRVTRGHTQTYAQTFTATLFIIVPDWRGTKAHGMMKWAQVKRPSWNRRTQWCKQTRHTHTEGWISKWHPKWENSDAKTRKGKPNLQCQKVDLYKLRSEPDTDSKGLMQGMEMPCLDAIAKLHFREHWTAHSNWDTLLGISYNSTTLCFIHFSEIYWCLIDELSDLSRVPNIPVPTSLCKTESQILPVPLTPKLPPSQLWKSRSLLFA